MKILIVEDEPVARRILEQIVSAQQEHQVTVATNGTDAWALLDDPSRFYDVVFLDLTMPEPDGFELLRRIKQSPLLQSTEVVLCTVSNDRTTVARAIALGAKHYLVKPCREDAVLAKLRHIQPFATEMHERRLMSR